MADPLSAVGLISLTNTILDFLELGHVAAGGKNLIRSAAFQLNIEGFLLARWAENLGIIQGSDPIDPKTKTLSKDVYSVVEGILKRILSLFDQSNDFIARYDVSQDLEPIPRIRRQSGAVNKIIQFAKERPLTGISRGVKWAIRDNKKFESLVGEIASLLRLLYRVVPEDAELVKRQLFTDTLPALQEADIEPVSEIAFRLEGDDDTSQSAIKFVSHAASIRAALPIWGVNQILSHSQIELPPVARPDFASELPQHLARWSTTIGNANTNQSIPLIVEWRWTEDIAQASENQQLVFKRDVARLTQLLSLAAQWPQYHTLKCLGYFIDNEYGPHRNDTRYGMIFRLPETALDSGFLSLRDAIERDKKAKVSPPSKAIRSYIAKELTTSVYYLLTLGWLHKAIQSDNLMILGYSPKSSSNPEVKLSGFEFARPDETNQRSLDTNRDAFADRYRHPECRSTARQTAEYHVRGYQKIYDIFSVGVLLFEIGAWRKIESVNSVFDAERRARQTGNQTFDEYFLRKSMEKLTASMSLAYAEAVNRCLTGTFDLGMEGQDGSSLMQSFEKLVLQPLVAFK